MYTVGRFVCSYSLEKDAEIVEQKPKPFVKWVGGKRQLIKRFCGMGLYLPEGFDSEKSSYFNPSNHLVSKIASFISYTFAQFMNLHFDKKLADNYTNYSQKARVMSESWVLNEIYCPNCGSNLYDYNNNKPVADFYCNKCSEDFELKSKKGKIGKKVSAGAYSQMIKRINSSQKPNFFFMGYIATEWDVNNFFIVPKHFFISEIIEQRKPLAESARRAGWVGSNILFSKIPKAGQIFYIENGKELDKKSVLEKWQKTVFLKRVNKADAKGWVLDIMNCLDSLNKKDFTLQDIYAFENDLSVIHPENKNIKPKIRQQLQFLRDKDYLEFVEAGKYRLK